MSSTEELGLRVKLEGGAQAASGLKSVADAQTGLAEATKKTNSATGEGKSRVEEYLSALRREHEQIGKNATQLREIEARYRGATAAQLDQVRALSSNIEFSKRAANEGGMLASAFGLITRATVVLTAALAALAPIAAFSQMQDDAKVTLSRINGITGSLAEARVVYRGLADDAIRLRVTQDATLTGYTRIAAAVKELGGTSTQARQINEIVLATAKASGIAQDEAAAAARQFAQALGSGVLQSDELRSIMENNQELARQLAKGLNVSVGELRKMGEEGKLTADVVANALLSRLPEVRDKLAEVPLTSADAWTKLKGVMAQFVVQGDQVEMKAGLIATALNGIANIIDRMNKQRTIGGVIMAHVDAAQTAVAAFTGTSDLLNEARLKAASDQATTVRGNATAALRAADNELAAQHRLGLEAAGKAALKGVEDYANSVASAGDKLQRVLDERKKKDGLQVAAWQRAISSGDPQAAEIAKAQLDKFTSLQAKAYADAESKIAQARRTEANKGGAEARAAASAQYREQIAQQEGFQAAVLSAERVHLGQLRASRDANRLSEHEYHRAAQAERLISLAEQQSIVEQELAIAEKAVARGDQTKKADVAKYLAELKTFGAKRIAITQETEDAIDAVERRMQKEREQRAAESNRAILDYINGSRDLVEAMKAENEERQFELSLLGQSEQAQARAQARRQVELNMRRQLTQAYKEYLAALDKADSLDAEKALTDEYNKRARAIRDNAAASAEVTTTIIDQRAELNQNRQFWDGFFQSLKGGWKGVRDYVKNFFFDYITKMLAQQFTLNIGVNATGGGGGLGGLLSGLLGGGGGGSSGGGLGGLLSGLLGAGSGGLGSLSGLMGFGSGAGILGALGGGANLMLTGLMGGGLSGMMGGIAMAAQAGVMPLLGALGPIGLALGGIYMIAKKFDGANGTAVRYAYGDNYESNSRPQERNTLSTTFGRLGLDGDAADQVRPIAEGMIKLENIVAAFMTKEQIARATASIGQGTSQWIGYDGDPTKAIAQMTKDMMQQRFTAIFEAMDFTRISAAIKGFAGDSDALAKYLGSVAAVMQGLSDNAKTFAVLFGEAINVDQLEGLRTESETLDQTLSRVVSVFTATNGVAILMGRDIATAFGAVGLASLDARQNLIDLAGGIQSLDQMTSAYYEKFYAETERSARALAAANDSVNAAFGELNLAVPKNRAEFRALVEAQDLSTEAGRAAWVTLMRVAGAFDAVQAAGENAANTVAVEKTDAYLQNFFTEQERAAMQLAEASRAVNAAFGDLNLAVPETRAEFRALIEAQDLTTESGRKTYNALMAIAEKFASVTAAANAAASALNPLLVSLDVVVAAGAAAAKTRLDTLFAIIDAGGESLAVKLQRKGAASLAAAQEFQAAYLAALAGNNGQENAASIAARTARDAALAQQAIMAGDLALLTTLQAQYGTAAEQMFDLEKWHREQIAAAGNNAATLLNIEQTYNARRNAILAGGLSAGLSTMSATLREWLNGLLLNQQLTTLTPAQRLAEARAQYEQALVSGDAGKITSSADAYLREARDYFASSAGYATIFAAVRAQIAALAAGGTVTVPTVPPSGSSGNSGGTTASTAATTAAAAASNAVEASAATTQAVVGMQGVLAEIMARTKNAVETEAATNRAADAANTERIVAAVSGPARIAV